MMKRRQFLKSSLAAGSAAGLTTLVAPTAAQGAAPAAGSPQIFELRLYHLRRGPNQKRMDDFLRATAVPAWNRAGIERVGVFNVGYGPDNPTIYVLLAAPTIQALLDARARFAADPEIQKAAVWNVPATDPAYVRIESSLLVGIAGMPHLEVPAQAGQSKPRIYELRIYEAHNEKAHEKKIEMFNIGEIEIFRKTGLTPVFFGQTLIGSKLPNLTYMLVFDDMAAREKNWSTFAAHPDWKKLSATPGFTDPEILTNISNVILRPASYSQV